MRHGNAPAAAWFTAILNQVDVANTKVSGLRDEVPMSAYERATGKPADQTDLKAFYAPGRFSLDKDQLPDKWVERARAGFWLGRDIGFVLKSKSGSAL